MSASRARRFLINWWLKRQLRKYENQRFAGTGSSVTFRDEPLVPKPPDVSWIEFNGDPPKVYADEVE